jgi:hypothetical protein
VSQTEGSNPLAPDPEPGAVTPTITRYQEIAAKLSAAITEAFTAVGSEPPDDATIRLVRGHRTIPKAFTASMVTLVLNDQQLQDLKKIDVNAARDAAQFEEAFRPVVEQLAHLGTDLNFTIAAKNAKVSSGALQLYQIVKALSRDSVGASLKTPLATLKRNLGRSRVKHRTTTPAVPPGEPATDRAAA